MLLRGARRPFSFSAHWKASHFKEFKEAAIVSSGEMPFCSVC